MLFQTFRRLLLNKCQDEFENRSKTVEAFDTENGGLSEEEMEQRLIAKHKMLGNIKFIGKSYVPLLLYLEMTFLNWKWSWASLPDYQAPDIVHIKIVRYMCLY